jgi:hypothetical protein
LAAASKLEEYHSFNHSSYGRKKDALQQFQRRLARQRRELSEAENEQLRRLREGHDEAVAMINHFKQSRQYPMKCAREAEASWTSAMRKVATSMNACWEAPVS